MPVTELPHHPTVALTVGGGHVISVDVELAPIIGLLWAIGIRTSSCCQEAEQGVASIAPLTLADMEKLYEVLTALDLDDDADLAASDVDSDTDMGANTGEYNLADHEPLFYARGWEWTVWADGGLRCNVLVPRTDLSWMESRLHKEMVRLNLAG
jgi:hypothetical protein